MKDELTGLALRLEERGENDAARELSLVKEGGSPPLELSVQKGTKNEHHIQRSPDVTFFYNFRTFFRHWLQSLLMRNRRKA